MSVTGPVRLTVILFIIIFCAAAVSCSRFPAFADKAPVENTPKPLAPENSVIYSEDHLESVIKAIPGAERYYYGLLGPEEKALYQSFLTAFLNMESSVHVFGFDNDTVYYVRSCVLRDYPEIWYAGSGTITEYHRNGKVIDKNYDIAYMYGPSEIRSKQAEIDNKTDDFLRSVEPSESDYEKLLRVYEYIILNTDYDQAAYRSVRSEQDDPSVEVSASIYGVLVKGKAICEGYSKAAQYLLGRLGIPCGLASGTSSKDGIAHAWNFLWLDGEPYFLDLTWGDPVYDDPNTSEGTITYDYFCITTKQLLATHIPDPAYPLPLCEASKYNYFVYNGLLLHEYSEDSVLEILYKELQRTGVSASVKFAGGEELDEACGALINDEKIFRLLEKIRDRGIDLDTREFSYMLDKENNILTIYPKFPEQKR
jgi:hypothetical protein